MSHRWAVSSIFAPRYVPWNNTKNIAVWRLPWRYTYDITAVSNLLGIGRNLGRTGGSSPLKFKEGTELYLPLFHKYIIINCHGMFHCLTPSCYHNVCLSRVCRLWLWRERIVDMKFRYCEEHSASVMLSWCTLWHLTGDSQQINN